MNGRNARILSSDFLSKMLRSLISPHLKRYLTVSSMRVAMLLRLARLNTQIRLIPQSAGSGVVAQHQALCLSRKLSFVRSF